MIIIKMYGEKWRLIIGDEVWQFNNLAELQLNLTLILQIKNEFGRIKE